jgi:D-alanine-D-alanine ligase
MNIVVLAGGISTERDVSLVSGSMIYKALVKKGHSVMMLDVFLGYPDTDWEKVFVKQEDWAALVAPITNSNPDLEKVKALRPDWESSFFGPHVIDICQRADIVFLALHGENGENGKIQACFDLMGIRYTGTDYVSSALSMNKNLSKEIFKQNSVPTPESVRLQQGEKIPDFPLPCVVKACRGGSSIGVALAFTQEEYHSALQEAFRYDTEVIIEQYIRGREFSVSVIQGKALPVIEIAPIQGFYDYKNKYQAGSTIETCPADLTEDCSKEMRGYAELAFRALRLEKYARMDFMMNEKGEMFCLEANTLPGMTPTSLLPQEAAAEGISFEDLCEMIIRISSEK